MVSDGHRQPSVAIYWDFENIHASLIEQMKGVGDVPAVAVHAAGAGRQRRGVDGVLCVVRSVAINRAYGNWQWFARYREALLHNAVELIQLFPPGAAAKNGADIKLCLDATEDMIRFPHVTTS